MTVDEKLERVLELVKIRDDATAELMVLIGGEAEDKPDRKARKVANKKSSSGRELCSECGSAGTRHFKTCSKAKAIGGWSKKPQTHNDTSEESALIPSEFQNVKLLKSQGKHSKEIAEQLDLSMREVNIAMSASDYTHYLDIRESQ